jgi:hypothetical protein
VARSVRRSGPVGLVGPGPEPGDLGVDPLAVQGEEVDPAVAELLNEFPMG